MAAPLAAGLPRPQANGLALSILGMLAAKTREAGRLLGHRAARLQAPMGQRGFRTVPSVAKPARQPVGMQWIWRGPGGCPAIYPLGAVFATLLAP